MKDLTPPWFLIVPSMFVLFIVVSLAIGVWIPEDSLLRSSGAGMRRDGLPSINPFVIIFMIVGLIGSAGVTGLVMRALATGSDDEPIDYDRL